jgi:hypothetical protein
MARVAQERDAGRFGEVLQLMTVACNACHAAEVVPTFYVMAPKARYSSIRDELN